MSLALYTLANGREHPARARPDAHAGLWYDKFFSHWEGIPLPTVSGLPKVKAREPSQNDAGGKAQWVAEMAKRRTGDQKLISEAVERLEALVRGLGGEPVRARTVWRFVSGLGRSHPVENGFVWHHTLGTPYLPASSIKGMLRAYTGTIVWNHARLKEIFGDEASGTSDAERNAWIVRRLTRIFGSELGEPGAQRTTPGSVIILDALPAEPIRLEPDVMTPHYSDWYQSEGDVAPGDWMSPNPIPFLTVAPGNSFLFGVVPRDQSKPEDKADSTAARKFLVDALRSAGAGAKTAVNYGRFEEAGNQESATGAKTTETGIEAAGRSADRPTARLQVGQRVLVYDEFAVVTAIRGDAADVRFDDGKRETIPMLEIKRP